jgi:hypothetical protein
LAGQVALSLSCVATGCVVWLHFLRPDLSPIWRRLSAYANGPYGAVMALAFLGVGGAMTAVGIGLRPYAGASLRTRVVPPLLGIAGAGMALSGIFATDPAGLPSGDEAIHSAASSLATLALIAASLLWSSQDLRAGDTPGADRPALVLAVAGAVLAAVSRVTHDTAIAGLGQRLLWTILLAWLARTGVQLSRHGGGARG